VSEKINGQVTMYSSEVGQTDDTPFITANGDTVKHGTIACPQRYEFGTVVEINGIRYKCNDRMHQRYRSGNYFDVWVADKQTALEWGRQNVDIIIYSKAEL
jgi:3D (Asp-Asp-Asp) domain-containing protein